ncbi:cytochrome P450 2D3-like isoform X2 [Branchiostoma floridae]|uniref:Cytochrome P450 2D3-like isoform X1 n=1 Tax=Branchiostoma floridae TaxID=7739 RepID=A0A9J7N7K6_BRAFL|nr:cytochrome P450 2D3-like isoform X1 [Branchiostoma floridae]XP_035696123.1 cytochrome P450 2D3-like isoform X2 [Branchiostoma floridae]
MTPDVGLVSLPPADSGALTAALVLVLVSMLVALSRRRPRDFPPAPPGVRAWPLLGHLPALGPEPHRTLAAWTDSCGDVLGLRFGMSDVVVLNSLEAMREALVAQGDAFSSRPRMFMMDIFSDGGKGLVFRAFGKSLMEQRKFAMVVFRDILSRPRTESMMIREAQTLASTLAQKAGRPTRVHDNIGLSLLNVTCSLCFGRRFETSDPRFWGFVHSLDMFAKNAACCQLFNICPSLARVPKINTPAVRVQTGIREVKEFVRSETEGHKVKFDRENIRDIIDAFVLEMESRRRSGRDLGSFTEREMEQVIFDLFFTGAETSSTCLRWAVFLMAVYPDVQARIHRELDTVLGPDGEVTLDKRAALPFLDATISEVLRFRPAAPFMYRCATKDSKLRDYFIPADTQVLVNLWSIHMDPKHWQNPDQFNPDRFLNSEGTVKIPEAFKAFGLGRRLCFGEQMARMEMFLFFAILMQHFTFKLPEGAPVPNTIGVFALTLSPPPHELCIFKRH